MHSIHQMKILRTGIPHQFVNVVEDCRIEKLMKRRYMGLAKTFYRGYQELNEEDFFEIQGEDLTTFNLADKINLNAKVGNFVKIEFSEKEREIVDMVHACETFADVAIAAEVPCISSVSKNKRQIKK